MNNLLNLYHNDQPHSTYLSLLDFLIKNGIKLDQTSIGRVAIDAQLAIVGWLATRPDYSVEVGGFDIRKILVTTAH